MAKRTAKRDGNIFDGVVRYFKETRSELRKVTWPTRNETINLTLIVVTVTAFMAIILGVIDWGFAQLFGLII